MGDANPENEIFSYFPSRDLGEKWRLAPVPLSAKLSMALFGKATGTSPD